MPSEFVLMGDFPSPLFPVCLICPYLKCPSRFFCLFFFCFLALVHYAAKDDLQFLIPCLYLPSVGTLPPHLPSPTSHFDIELGAGSVSHLSKTVLLTP